MSAQKRNPGLEAEMQLRAHFAKKRASTRCWIAVPVDLVGKLGAVGVRLVDVSATGILVALTDSEFEDTTDLMRTYEAVQQRLGTKVLVRFLGQDYIMRGEVARVTECPYEGRTLLAVQFAERLTGEQCVSLGIPAAPTTT